MKIPKIKTTVYHFFTSFKYEWFNHSRQNLFFGSLFIRNQVISSNPLKRINPIS
ncbi:hypothetical protein LPE509_02250 [Legionella pneumophila subsp. pneumophila LPE509]|nr:hypothetical protein LPE509_02250 [Legionella pneumophila subsp. pneumophila LPE509]